MYLHPRISTAMGTAECEKVFLDPITGLTMLLVLRQHFTSLGQDYTDRQCLMGKSCAGGNPMLSCPVAFSSSMCKPLKSLEQ